MTPDLSQKCPNPDCRELIIDRMNEKMSIKAAVTTLVITVSLITGTLALGYKIYASSQEQLEKVLNIDIQNNKQRSLANQESLRQVMLDISSIKSNTEMLKVMAAENRSLNQAQNGVQQKLFERIDAILQRLDNVRLLR